MTASPTPRPPMPPHFDRTLEELGLTKFASLFEAAALPAVAFDLSPVGEGTPPDLGASKLGGTPDLPAGFEWPINTDPDGKNRPLDFLLQIDLAAVRPAAEAAGVAESLPSDGLLSFFYDLAEQPWGYDPAALNGFHVAYTPAGVPLTPTFRPPCEDDEDQSLILCRLTFRPTVTFPHQRSRARERLDEQLEATGTLTEEDDDGLWEASARLEHPAGKADDVGAHHLLGHSWNVQGDMQLEAQLVSHGLYTGDESGYEDPRAEALEQGADD
ncbi:hypothetical protein LzC2_17190 [Planctomycetes bacterium LzC2]|uniref:DUF1963 domain-containing protein n=1 Tax=Alienimonas chondri TaxID=2681879 RepID=A0ABX1VCH3_9PLAN|nr:hypothetical protein [Alienimonas chondri]